MMQTSEEPQHCLKILTTTFIMGIVEPLFLTISLLHSQRPYPVQDTKP